MTASSTQIRQQLAKFDSERTARVTERASLQEELDNQLALLDNLIVESRVEGVDRKRDSEKVRDKIAATRRRIGEIDDVARSDVGVLATFESRISEAQAAESAEREQLARREIARAHARVAIGLAQVIEGLNNAADFLPNGDVSLTLGIFGSGNTFGALVGTINDLVLLLETGPSVVRPSGLRFSNGRIGPWNCRLVSFAGNPETAEPEVPVGATA